MNNKSLKLIFGVAQLFFMIAIMFILETQIGGQYSSIWKDATPGLLWEVYFFGTQQNILDNFYDVIEMDLI